MKTTRLPAEWEEQDLVQLTWPHKNSDWRSMLSSVESVFITIAKEIATRQKLLIVCQNKRTLLPKLKKNGVDVGNVELFEADSNDTWARDHGGITIYENNNPVILDFVFNGWGLKFPADKDNLITKKLCDAGLFSNALHRYGGMALEGGGIESDGKGTLLTTSECLLSKNRNPHISKAKLDIAFQTLFGAQKVLWLDYGYLAGDDTDSHIDTLARLCPNNVILYQSCDDEEDEHYFELLKMKQQLEEFVDADGMLFKLTALPWPKAKYAKDGHRLPATYANFLIINGAVLVPTYNDEKDAKVLQIISEVFAGREIIGLDCSILIEQHGSLHCVTMQYPKGVLCKL
jgi:agmatine deiminase